MTDDDTPCTCGANLSALVAKMRRPEVHVHPDALQRIGVATGAILDAETERLTMLVRPNGVAIIADPDVQPGEVLVVDGGAPDLG